MDSLPVINTFVRHMLEDPFANNREWTVQGLGMVRTYLAPDKRHRLNVWHSDFMIPNVTRVHDHPWDFWSLILAGSFRNLRFKLIEDGATNWWQQKIRCGEDGGKEGLAKRVCLMPDDVEYYKPGDSYHQAANEIHLSEFEDGTVTLNDRSREQPGHLANVFWPASLGCEGWITAEPRPARPSQVLKACEVALFQFRKSA